MKKFFINLNELSETPTDIEKIPVAPVSTDEVVLEQPTENEIGEQRVALEIDEVEEEVTRQEELVEGMEALRMIASKIVTPKPTDIALFRVAANMAVAGTKQTAQSFLPAMESNKAFALEGFAEKIQEIKDKIASLKIKLLDLKKQKLSFNKK